MNKHVDYGREQAAMEQYFREGTERAMALGNRGPLRFTDDGRLQSEILDAYERLGFYVFEGVIAPAELAELEADYLDIMDRMPTGPDSTVDRHGRPALGSDLGFNLFYWAKPLGDPFGGTDINKGRHTHRMFEPTPAEDAPEHVIMSIVATPHFSEAYLRMCGHPELLKLAAAVNGEDFVPFQEGVVIKHAGEGASFSWHQDGQTHWDSPKWNQHSHGFNLMPQLYGSTAANGVWYLPGTHKVGRLDMGSLGAEAGGDRLPGATPLICKPGDVAISNRQVVHGSFANTSDDTRVTLGLGFHPKASVIDVVGYDFDTNQPVTFDAAFVRKRCEMIGYSIAARRQHFPDETPFVYRPHAESGETFVWNDAARRAIRGYNKWDLRI